MLPIPLMGADAPDFPSPFNKARVGGLTKPVEGRTPVADAGNAFAFDLYQKLAKDKLLEGKNLFFSPYSVTTALDMAAEGARSETAEQMGTVLRYPAAWRRAGAEVKTRPWDEAPVHSAMESLTRRFAEQPLPPELSAKLDAARKAYAMESEAAQKFMKGPKPDWDAYRAQLDKAKKVGADFDALAAQMPGYELSIANVLWGESTFHFVPEYITSLKTHYGAGLTPVSFIGNPDGARVRINDWIALKTKDKIKDMLKPGTITSMTRLVLANAIYFYGTWQVPFEEKLTKFEDFFAAGGKTAVAMMNQRDMAHVSYAACNGDGSLFATPDMVDNATKPTECYPDAKGFLMAELPYKGDGLVMTILVPQSPEGLPALEKMLTSDHLREWIGMLDPRRTNVALPKFKFKTSYRLNDTLAALGMPRAFSSSDAQFEGMTTDDALFIGLVQHDAFVDVNEKGTEAAAATVITMVGTGGRPSSWPFIPHFRADRPFVFLIRDRVTGTILFVGRVLRPEV